MILPFCLRCLKLLGSGLNAPQHARDVDLQDLVEFPGRDVDKGLNLGDAGIVDHDVEAA
jgi:hypothetical protein